MTPPPSEAATEPRQQWAPPLGLPNPAPRPPDEEAQLKKVWRQPRGWRFPTVVNNNWIGVLYIGTAVLSLILAGILALIMRAQLAVPDANVVGHELYNQLFTMHGTMMMFLFAVPAVEAVAVYLLPAMLAARDLPFPRLSAYAFLAYAIGGLVFFSSIFFGAAPDGGWFMYPPLTNEQYSPGINQDFWLLGIGFIEISAIAGAIEIIVGILRTRPPGMKLGDMPIFAWAMLVFGAMVVFAFPAVIVATALLELERAFHWPFFDANRGGDPLLWQHLFWFFGHPEVYIIFLPAAGMVSMIIPAMAGVPLVGYSLVVLALVGTGFLSFGLWVHHMFTTGIPQLSLSFFFAASMAVSIPSGIQVFAWIATLASGRPRLEVPMLFMLGFLFIFVLGGLTGVMVAVVPFDWQVHDTHFVVAHLHYVLIGGMVFPLLGAFYYWAPTASGKKMSDRLGKATFWFTFIGVNLTFFPLHIAGLLGMPRRVYTYPAGMGLELPNLLSSIGAAIVALGGICFVLDVARNFRLNVGADAGNPWNAGTLEWLPNENYAARSIPIIRSREPLWDDPDLVENVNAGRYYLPGTVTGRRETIITSPVDAVPQYLQILPGPSWGHVLGAVGTAGFFLSLTVKLVYLAFAFGIIGVIAILVWLWRDTDHGPISEPVAVGEDLVLPVYVTGPAQVSWWAMVVLLLVDGTGYACILFSYLYLWLVNGDGWLPPSEAAPDLLWACGAALLLLGSSGLIWAASRLLRRVARGRGAWPMRLAMLGALALLAASWWLDFDQRVAAGLRPSESSYDATVAMILSWQGFHVVVLLVMALYTLARSLAGRLDGVRRVTFDNTMLLWHYTVVQGLLGLALTHGFPLAIGQGAG